MRIVYSFVISLVSDPDLAFVSKPLIQNLKWPELDGIAVEVQEGVVISDSETEDEAPLRDSGVGNT